MIELRDFRQATMAGFNALREDQIELRRQMTAGFANVGDRFAEMTDRFAKVDLGFMEMRGKFDAAAGHQQIVDLLNTLIEREHGE